MAVGAIVARILTQYSDKGSKAATKDINKLGKSFDAFAKKSAKAFGLATLAAAAFAVKIGKDAVLRRSHVDLVLLHVAVEVEVLPVDEAEHVVELGRSALTVVRGKRRAVLPTNARAVEDDGRCEVCVRARELPTGQHVLMARGDAPLD